MKLLGSLTSPYVRKTRIVLAEKKIDCEFVVDNGGQDGLGLADHNPLCRIPVLLLDDGTSLFDSRVIVEYLDNLAPNNRLIPPPGRERIQIKRWEALADGILDAAVAAIMESRRPAKQQSKDVIERNHKVIDFGLAAFANELGQQTWCHGTAITLADIALGSVLGYLDFRFPELDWRTSHANLALHFDKLMQRPSFSDTTPQG
ncbi:MAG: glutathione S-transferase N-terminal domain-containing protein [Rhodocyclaceae bacterium]|nr:glutathione S-transferase N-terminal domain-containing protein [Rhodocyclaceae bacterium]MDZ4213686.1 glutathione S-transferase N-terminal domain-containing protein [Rhodocyclaceae bacterium]